MLGPRWRGRRGPRRRRAPPARPATLPQKGAESCASPRRPDLRLLLRPGAATRTGRRSRSGRGRAGSIRGAEAMRDDARRRCGPGKGAGRTGRRRTARSGPRGARRARRSGAHAAKPQPAEASRPGRCARQAGCDAQRSKHRTPGLRSRMPGAQRAGDARVDGIASGRRRRRELPRRADERRETAARAPRRAARHSRSPPPWPEQGGDRAETGRRKKVGNVQSTPEARRSRESR